MILFKIDKNCAFQSFKHLWNLLSIYLIGTFLSRGIKELHKVGSFLEITLFSLLVFQVK